MKRGLNLLALGILAIGSGKSVAADTEIFPVTWTGVDPGMRFSVASDVYGGFTTTGGRMAMRFDLDSGPLTVHGYCIDLAHPIWMGNTQPACLAPYPDETEFPLSTEEWCQINSIIGLPTPTTSVEGAATQVAIWKVLEPTLNALDSAIEDEANLYLSAVQGACPLSCEDEPTFDEVVTVDDDPDSATYGRLIFDIQILRGVAPSPAVSLQEVGVSVTNGTLSSPSVAVTDANGFIQVVVDTDWDNLLNGDQVVVDLTLVGRTLVRIKWDDPNIQQIVFPDECEKPLTVVYDVFKQPGPDPDPLGDPRTIGFWKHQLATALGIKRGRNHVDAATLESWLPLSIYGVQVTTLQEAYDLLWIDNAPMQQRAQQQCLATMFNFMWGEVGMTSEIDLDGDGTIDFTFAEMLALAEDAYYAGDYELAKDYCDLFNNLNH